MYQIDVSTAASAQPASSALGTVGYFTDGNAATGVASTILPAEFMNALMLEIMNAITGAGLTLSKSSFNQLYTAIKTIGQSGSTNYAADFGVANAYAATYAPTVSAPADGIVRTFKVKTANTGASTFILDGSGTSYPIYGLNGTPLQGGELSVNGIAVIRFNSSLSTSGAWVLYHCGASPMQIADGTASHHAASVGQVQSGASSYAVDTGSANACVIAFAPAMTSVPDGFAFRVKVKASNTGASTVAINGLAAIPIVGAAHSALQGGELIANGDAVLMYNSSLGACVLLESTGGAAQVGSATQPLHALQQQQKGYSRATASGSLVVPAGVTTMYLSGCAPGGGGGGG
ncbi:hypothetical protein, partial [Paraburkholderia piptadeniae]|uniref:hypothetical protein n=1 Tax=Paraburkholderia piptadeniae TaxID=1701573 RepID=UPI001C45A476